MLSYSSETGWVYNPFEIAIVCACVAFSVWRNRVRRRSLRQREDGMYVWVEWHGGERCSLDDPAAPGGAWDSEGDGGGGD
ncbi:hypothetical protein [uncultured Tateyamaria sp.]|uniref:hypothetical protein n=1 Tax=uncultured Tateyamaria sp. TaxID=455651 RepID=UPI00261B27D7|nr:hypothetical protein [uncultured Tateyamaria sp.]